MLRDGHSAFMAVLLAFLALPAGAETIYVSNEKDNTLSVVDGTSLKVTNTIKVGGRPLGIVFNHDMTQVYVCVGDENRIDVVDLASRKAIDRLPSGRDPELLALHPDGVTLFVANEDDNMVTVLDTKTKKVLSEIQVPGA